MKLLSISPHRRIAAGHLARFTRHFAELLAARLSVADALQLIANNAIDRHTSALARALLNQLDKGKSLSDAVAAYPRWFHSIYVQLIITGEASGKLAPLMQQLAEYSARADEIRTRLRRACAYPILVLMFAGTLLVGLLGVVVPRLHNLFGEDGAHLPWLTRQIVGASDWLLSAWPWLGGWLLVLLVMLLLASRLGVAGRLAESMAMHLPVVGRLLVFRQRELFLRSLALMAGARLPLHQAIERLIVHQPSRVFRARLAAVPQLLYQGKSLEQAMAGSGAFAPADLLAARLGQQGGRLEQLCMQQAEQYAQLVQRRLEQLVLLLEPGLMLLLGALIGAIVLAVYLPLFSIGQAL